MADTDRKIRGQVLKTYFVHIKKKWGVDGLKTCQEVVGITMDQIFDDNWYDNQFSEDIQRWIWEVKGDDAARKMGVSTATEVGIISYVAWMAGMKKVLETASKQFANNLTHGKVWVDIDGKVATLHVQDMLRHKGQCLGVHGICEGTLKLTKNKGTVEKVSCELDGDDSCSYRIDWG